MENSPFAKLSPELRNKIYELVIGEGEPTLMNIGAACRVETARLCKEMRSECLPMCFSEQVTHINITADVELAVNSFHKPPSLDLRSDTSEPTPSFIIVPQRLILHPQTCYNSLARLELTLELDSVDYGFDFAWQVWEPSLRRLAGILRQRNLSDQRLCLKADYSAEIGYMDRDSGSEKVRVALEGLGLKVDDVSCNPVLERGYSQYWTFDLHELAQDSGLDGLSCRPRLEGAKSVYRLFKRHVLDLLDTHCQR